MISSKEASQFNRWLQTAKLEEVVDVLDKGLQMDASKCSLVSYGSEKDKHYLPDVYEGRFGDANWAYEIFVKSYRDGNATSRKALREGFRSLLNRLQSAKPKDQVKDPIYYFNMQAVISDSKKGKIMRDYVAKELVKIIDSGEYDGVAKHEIFDAKDTLAVALYGSKAVTANWWTKKINSIPIKIIFYGHLHHPEKGVEETLENLPWYVEKGLKERDVSMILPGAIHRCGRRKVLKALSKGVKSLKSKERNVFIQDIKILCPEFEC